ncbi:TaqI-like C-terminal specificity domain-containing protein [Pedobacter sp. Leaf170]|uniref:TaqI-like C-terminal specificity domain-containing protein n=1 Tax=Pedobacter sp. Leaf170 TaxID=2876558 RepID=UPI001E33A992|nr:TaqI-like C-terminal specificity domain-containing protein [Pedobacter sp. Leaf170]
MILSDIEKGIKAKIEAIGTRIKDWDINIYRGVLTGYNEAFIIDKKKKEQLIAEDPKSAEIIRPILRGRDIKRYTYDFADLWLINTHNGIKEKGLKPIDINDYPAIKQHLDKYYTQLVKRTDKGDTPYNLRNCAYMEDFNSQKIIWIELVDKGRFALDVSDKYLTLNGTFIMIGEDLEFICSILNNPVSSWHFNTFCISSGVGTNQWRELYVKELYIPNIPKNEQQPLLDIFNELMILEKTKQNIYHKIKEMNNMVYSIFKLTPEEIAFIDAQ